MPHSALVATWVPPQSSRETSSISTIRTQSPYFSPNSAIAPSASASARSISIARTARLALTQSFTTSSTSRTSSGESGCPWVKSKRSLSGSHRRARPGARASRGARAAPREAGAWRCGFASCDGACRGRPGLDPGAGLQPHRPSPEPAPDRRPRRSTSSTSPRRPPRRRRRSRRPGRRPRGRTGSPRASRARRRRHGRAATLVSAPQALEADEVASPARRARTRSRASWLSCAAAPAPAARARSRCCVHERLEARPSTARPSSARSSRVTSKGKP